MYAPNNKAFKMHKAKTNRTEKRIRFIYNYILNTKPFFPNNRQNREKKNQLTIQKT